MGKHLFWAVVVLSVAFIGGYVTLVATGHPNEAGDLAEFGGVLLVLAILVAMFS